MQYSTQYGNTNLDQIGAYSNNGTMHLLDSSGVDVAVLTFGAVAFQSASSGSILNNVIASDTSAVGGTVASIQFQDSLSNPIYNLSVKAASDTTGVADMTMASLIVSAGDTVRAPTSPGINISYTTF